eukprot:scaffold193444_cov20-Tisochrysis_lutea.AAC.1
MREHGPGPALCRGGDTEDGMFHACFVRLHFCNQHLVQPTAELSPLALSAKEKRHPGVTGTRVPSHAIHSMR